MLRRLARNTVAGFAGNLVQKVLAFVTTLIIARGLGEHSFGVYSFVGVFLFFFGFITDLGIERVLTRELARTPDRAGVLLGNAILLKLVLCGAAVPGAVATGWLMGFDSEVLYCVLLAALCLPLSLDLLFRGYFQSRYRIEVIYYITVPTSISYLLLAAACVVFDLPVHALFYAGLLNAGFTLLLFLAVVSRSVTPNLRPDRAVLSLLLKDAGQMGAFVLMFMLAMRIDQILLFQLRGSEDVAYYAVAVRLTEVLSMVPEAVMLSVFPLLAASQYSAPERFQRTYRLTFKYLTILILPVALVLTLARHEIVSLAFGARYAESANAVSILAWGMFFAYTGAVYLNLFIVQALHRLMLLVSLIALGFNVALNVWLIPEYGAAGAAVATVLSNLVGFAFWLAHPSTTEYMRVCLKESVRPGVSVILAAAVIAGSDLVGWLAVVVALLLYTVALVAVRGVGWADFALLRRILTRQAVAGEA